jgi:putative transposase
MPRTARASAANVRYYVLNRSNHRARVFQKDADYEALGDLRAEAKPRQPMRVLGYCVMHNHPHLAPRPLGDGNFGRWMHWLLTARMRRYQRHDHSTGHVWQGRFKAFPIQEDEHLMEVLRDIGRKPLRVSLVEFAEQWPWSRQAAFAAGRAGPLIDPGPVPRGSGWVEAVDAPIFEPEVEAIRRSVRRDAPFGSEPWACIRRLTTGGIPVSEARPVRSRTTLQRAVECPTGAPRHLHAVVELPQQCGREAANRGTQAIDTHRDQVETGNDAVPVEPRGLSLGS